MDITTCTTIIYPDHPYKTNRIVKKLSAVYGAANVAKVGKTSKGEMVVAVMATYNEVKELLKHFTDINIFQPCRNSEQDLEASL